MTKQSLTKAVRLGLKDALQKGGSLDDQVASIVECIGFAIRYESEGGESLAPVSSPDLDTKSPYVGPPLPEMSVVPGNYRDPDEEQPKAPEPPRLIVLPGEDRKVPVADSPAPRR